MLLHIFLYVIVCCAMTLNNSDIIIIKLENRRRDRYYLIISYTELKISFTIFSIYISMNTLFINRVEKITL